MAFQKDKQNVTASELLQALADGQDIHLSRCTITGLLDVNRLFDHNEKFQTDKLHVQVSENCKTLMLSQSLTFDKCVFEENAVFASPWSQPESVAVNFKADVIFNNSTFRGQTRFRNAHFCGTAGFDGCTFAGVVTFKNAIFKKDAKLRTATFNGYCLLGNASFNGDARFTNTHFAKGANFSGVNFGGYTDFDGVYSSSRAVPATEAITFSRRYGEDESFWRFVKQSAHQAGYYQLAGECFYKERCARLWRKFRGPNYRSLARSKKTVHWLLAVRLLPELIFGRLLFGYGERPVRVLLAGAVIIVLCAFFYSHPGTLTAYRQGTIQPSFLQGLYFSTITFTTLGYGDLYPSPNGLCRIMAMAEAVTGGCLMALFVVCLAKRFSRG